LVGTIGKSLILSDEVEEGIINPRLVKLSLHKDISRQFIKCYLDSPQAHGFFGGFSHGGTMEILNLGILKQLPICLPPIEEQKEIVNQVFQLFNFAKKVEQRVNSAQSQVNNLTQSILAKAFRGELTAEWRELNQALITGENSAEALLKKIKLEREKLKPVKKVNKVKKKT
jgi:type I restriction enzyme S subunit